MANTIKSTILKITTSEDGREQWLNARRELEQSGCASTVEGKKPYRKGLNRLRPIISFLLRITGLYHIGHRNSLDLIYSDEVFNFKHLPRSFDGYKILHISDPHFPNLPGVSESAAELVKGESYDLCVITGDFNRRFFLEPLEIESGIRTILDAVSLKDGVLAILGNHDGCNVVNLLENLGISVLLNETIRLTREGESIYITGTDDVSVFYTEKASNALVESPQGFKIALIHSPELAGEAAEQGYSLYLTGHTHGGQVCLPGGKPILTFLRRHKNLAQGRWRFKDMDGYTSCGLGVAALPVRFNSRGEVTIITLHCDSSESG